MVSGPREPSIRQATRYSSGDIWMTWPSARRASDGGWLYAESLYSPSSSTPPASRGGQAGPRASAGGRGGAAGPVVTGPATAGPGLFLPHMLARDVRDGWGHWPRARPQAGGAPPPAGPPPPPVCPPPVGPPRRPVC